MSFPKFNLSAALDGDPVRLRNGKRAYVRHEERILNTQRPLFGYVDVEEAPEVVRWERCGNVTPSLGPGEYDIISMWSEQITFEHWPLLDPGIRYIALDQGADFWRGFSDEPLKTSAGDWSIPFLRGKTFSLRGLSPTLFPVVEWEQSLIERPN